MENNNSFEKRSQEFAGRDYVKTAILGGVLVVAGAAIILNNLGIISFEIKQLIVSWQMLLIVLGFAGLARKNYKTGAILIAVGAFFIMPLIPGFRLAANFVADFWPALLVVAGILMIVTPGRFSRRPHVHYADRSYGNGEDRRRAPSYETYSEDGYIDRKFVFSGSEESFVGPVFRGGKLEVVFGGTNLDLTRTSLPEDQDAHLYVKGAFGGCSITVPAEWKVEIKNTSFLGGVTDSRPRVERTSTRKLIIDIECAFGGAEIR